MTGFQKLALIAFAVVVLVSHGKDIYAWLKAKLPAVKLPVIPRPAVAPPRDYTGDVLVNELLDVSALREYFVKANCVEGVEACSSLLKILIDHKHPHAG